MTTEQLRQLHQQAEEVKRNWELHDRACRNLFAKAYPALPHLLDIAEAAKRGAFELDDCIKVIVSDDDWSQEDYDRWHEARSALEAALARLEQQ